MTQARRALGAEGEARAAAYLEERGYRIADRNVRAGGVELDLVAVRGRTVVFVEVKSRSSQRHGSPVLAVDARKQARIARGAAAWLRENARGPIRGPMRGPMGSRSVRFDVIGCLRTGDGSGDESWQIEHWPGAFDAP